MRVEEFVSKLRLAEQSKTIYIKGCFGAPMTAANKKRYTSNLKYNANRASMINACSADTFGFDCVCLIKGILWGWTADKSKNYGGATYASSGIPDVGADALVKHLKDVSTDFSHIQVGEVVWISGHVGVYVGGGKVIECSPSWDNGVQYTNVKNLGYQEGHSRTWTKHGKLPWMEYSNATPTQSNASNALEYIVKKGDTLSKIAKSYGITLAELCKLNPQVKDPNKIYVGQTIRVK